VTFASALFAPATIAGHADHEATLALALNATERSGVPLHLYAELPYSTRFGWPHWVTGEAPNPALVPEERWEQRLAELPLRRERLEAHPVRLPDGEAARKLEAVRAYATQFAALEVEPFGLLSHPRVLPFELMWSVH
jgi:LmbE family N-acetylglucosaminyl deacetylase